jgi:CubicO group peptidase (beta-lactamase class C family)
MTESERNPVHPSHPVPMLFDLASLTKPLVTAPLALAYLNLNVDRRWQLGFHDREGPLTVRQLLSHSAGLPPWRPFTGERVADQVQRAVEESLRTIQAGN